MLQACPRRWFLYNFGRDLGGELGRRYLAERKLSYWQAFAGQLADDGVTELIRHYKKHKVWRKDIDDWLHKCALEYIRDSKAYANAASSNEPLPPVKRQVLDKYFYNEIPDRDEHRRVLDDARQAVANFFLSDIPSRVERSPEESLMCDHKDGEFPWAEHDGVPVYAVYDFAIRLPDNVTIFDWKTGKVTPEKEAAAIEQLHWYALYVHKAWDMPLEHIWLAPVFLSANGGYEETQCDSNRLSLIRDRWIEKHSEIKEKMNALPQLEMLQMGFPMTANLRECAGCTFRSCPGYERVRDPQVANPVKFAILGDNDYNARA